MEPVPKSKEIISVHQKGCEVRASLSVPHKVQLGSLLRVPMNQNSTCFKLQSKKGIPWRSLLRLLISKPLEVHTLINAYTHSNP